MFLTCCFIGVHMKCNVVDMCYEKYKWYNFVGIVGVIIFVISLDDYEDDHLFCCRFCFKVDDCITLSPPSLNETDKLFWLSSYRICCLMNDVILCHWCTWCWQIFCKFFNDLWLLFFSVLEEAAELPIWGWLTFRCFIGFPLSWWA